jgi:hypothetical protein
MRKTKNWSWSITENAIGGGYSTENAQLSVLMDIRDELQGIRRRLDCSDTLQIPSLLRSIVSNTKKRRKRRTKKKV